MSSSSSLRSLPTLTHHGANDTVFQRVKNSEPGGNGGRESAPSLWRRRQTLVNKEHQLRFTTVLLCQMTAVMLAIGGFAFIESQSTMRLVLRHLQDFPISAHQLHENNQAFLFKIIFVIGLTGVVEMLFGVYASHKLAGPVLKMTRLLERAADGDYSGRISFRKGDHLESLAAAVNRWLQTLTADQLQTRSAITRIELEVARLRETPNPSPEAVDALCVQLGELAQVEVSSPALTAC